MITMATAINSVNCGAADCRWRVFARLTSFTHFSVDTGKEVLRKAILAYHPDKQTGQASSSKWQVLAEEITKVRVTGRAQQLLLLGWLRLKSLGHMYLHRCPCTVTFRVGQGASKARTRPCTRAVSGPYQWAHRYGPYTHQWCDAVRHASMRPCTSYPHHLPRTDGYQLGVDSGSLLGLRHPAACCCIHFLLRHVQHLRAACECTATHGHCDPQATPSQVCADWSCVHEPCRH